MSKRSIANESTTGRMHFMDTIDEILLNSTLLCKMNVEKALLSCASVCFIQCNNSLLVFVWRILTEIQLWSV